MSKSAIEWTEDTWNPVTGCTKVSTGCKNCYAEAFSYRLQKMGQIKYRNGFKITLHPEVVSAPLSWNKPRMVFVNSMSDLFHEDVPLEFIQSVFSTMHQTEHHTYQILTKRHERLLELSDKLEWSENIWMGVSVENSKQRHRIDYLRQVPAKIRFLSLEPLLGPIPDLNLDGIHWVVVGGESGPRSRPIEQDWVLDLRDQCIEKNVPFFFKQWGGTNKKAAGRIVEGVTWDEMPLVA